MEEERVDVKNVKNGLLTYLLPSFLSYCHMENPNPDSKSGGLFYSRL